MNSAYPWKITEHVCGQCLGRVLERVTPDGIVSRCSDCGREKEGGHRSICTCGLTLRTGKPAGFYCARNYQHKPGENQAIVGLFDEAMLGGIGPCEDW